MKSFQPKDGRGPPSDPGRNGERNFRGQKRSNDTHQSTTDPDARLYRKGDGQPAGLCYLGHLLMENRNGLIVDAELTQATGWAERAAAEAMVETTAPSGGLTLGPTKVTTQQPIPPSCATSVLPRMSRRTRPIAARPSTTIQPGTPAMRPASVQAHRRAVRLDESCWRFTANKAPRTRKSWMDGHPPGCRLQPHSTAEPLGGDVKVNGGPEAGIGRAPAIATRLKSLISTGTSYTRREFLQPVRQG